jgi:hypothetical protein
MACIDSSWKKGEVYVYGSWRRLVAAGRGIDFFGQPHDMWKLLAASLVTSREEEQTSWNIRNYVL